MVLSPAARIVKAFDDHYELLGPLEENWQEVSIAAALRELADNGEYLFDHQDGKVAVVRVDDVLAIAAELEDGADGGAGSPA